jgi:hypothetical protein
MTTKGVFEEEKVGVRPAMGMVVERNPNRPFLVKFRLLKVAILFAVKITWAWPKNKGRSTIFIYGRIYEVALCIFRPSLHPTLWWLQSSEISTCGIFFNPQTVAAISMHDHAPMLVPLIHARSIIPKSNKTFLI